MATLHRGYRKGLWWCRHKDCWWASSSDTLLFLPFYHFPSTADPLPCTTPTWSSVRPVQTFTWPPSTIPYTHHTISLAPHCRFGIWPMDHMVLFPIFSSFSVTHCALLRADWSQAIVLCGQDLIICFTAHEPCAHFSLSFVIKPLVSTLKRRKFFPQNSDLVHSALLLFVPSPYFAPLTCLSCTVLHLHFTPSCTPHYHARRLLITPLLHPQSLIGFTLWLSLIAHSCWSSCTQGISPLCREIWSCKLSGTYVLVFLIWGLRSLRARPVMANIGLGDPPPPSMNPGQWKALEKAQGTLPVLSTHRRRAIEQP